MALTGGHWLQFAVNFFVALFALLDPLGNVPLFAAATGGASAPGRRLTAAYIALFAFAFMSFFFLTGLALLRSFGVSMPAFRIAGGVLLLLLGLDMSRGDLTRSMAEASGEIQNLSVQAYARERFESLIVPFGIPLLIGPGAISCVIIYAEEARGLGFTGGAAGIGVIALVCLLLAATFSLTGLIARVLGRIGMLVVVRVLGLILCAVAIQFMITGVAEATHGFMRQGAATPYPVPHN